MGLVTLQRTDAWTDDELQAVQDIVDRSALMLDTAFVFGDIRSLATTEERRRLAREIHDGVAQELAGLGYVLDDVAHRETDPERGPTWRPCATSSPGRLRVAAEHLRVAQRRGAGVGARFLAVHLRQTDRRPRRPHRPYGARGGCRAAARRHRGGDHAHRAEAITNARRHSRAKNLWVTLRTSPPRAFVRIADDGVGLRDKRADSYGLDIMRERATRIGGRLDIRQRVGGGPW